MNERRLAQPEDEPLFLDEPPNLRRPAKSGQTPIEDLFPSEDDLPLASGHVELGEPVDWQELNALDPQAVETRSDAAPTSSAGAGRTVLVLALILAGAIAGFALVSALLN